MGSGGVCWLAKSWTCTKICEVPQSCRASSLPSFAALPQPCSAGAVQASHVPVVHIPSDASLSAALLSSTVLFFFPSVSRQQ